MSAPTYATFAARFLELVSPTPTSDQQAWITATLAREWARCSASFWGAEQTEACLLRGAHQWALVRMASGGALPTGALTSESAETWSRSYSAPSNSRSDSDQQHFGRTAYGIEYLALRDARAPAFARVSK